MFVPVYEGACVCLAEHLGCTVLGLLQQLLLLLQCTHSKLPAFAPLPSLLLQNQTQSLPEPENVMSPIGCHFHFTLVF